LKSGIEIQYITDAQLGLFMTKADVVLLGANSILAGGSVVNKAEKPSIWKRWINEHGVQTLSVLKIGLTKPTTGKDY